MTSSRKTDEITRLNDELKSERAARDEAEAQLKFWREKVIDTKMDSLHTRRDASVVVDEIAEGSRTTRASARSDENSSSQMKREIESLKGQREMLLKTLEDLQMSDDEEDENLSPEERLEKERNRRRAAEGLAKALRAMFDEAESSRVSAEENSEKLRADGERSRCLLAAAEDLLVQQRSPLEPSLTKVGGSPVKRITAGKHEEGNNTMIAVCAIGLIVAVAGVAVIIVRRRKNQ